MATRDTPFAPGTPCWVDVSSSDIDAAARFYASVFGWRWQAGPPEFGGYGTFFSGKYRVAGGMPKMRSDSPDVWTTHIATADLDETVQKATAAGASMIGEPGPAGDLGSLAVLADPTGGVFGVWQAASHTGFGKYNEPGSVTWDEFESSDYQASLAFYGDLFGWDWDTTSDTEDFRYRTAVVGGDAVAGVMDCARTLPQGVPSHWTVYFNVEDIDDAAAAVRANGGQIHSGPTPSPFGHLVDATDPFGAAFKLLMVNPPRGGSS